MQIRDRQRHLLKLIGSTFAVAVAVAGLYPANEAQAAPDDEPIVYQPPCPFGWPPPDHYGEQTNEIASANGEAKVYETPQDACAQALQGMVQRMSETGNPWPIGWVQDDHVTSWDPDELGPYEQVVPGQEPKALRALDHAPEAGRAPAPAAPKARSAPAPKGHMAPAPAQTAPAPAAPAQTAPGSPAQTAPAPGAPAPAQTAPAPGSPEAQQRQDLVAQQPPAMAGRSDKTKPSKQGAPASPLSDSFSSISPGIGVH